MHHNKPAYQFVKYWTSIDDTENGAIVRELYPAVGIERLVGWVLSHNRALGPMANILKDWLVNLFETFAGRKKTCLDSGQFF